MGHNLFKHIAVEQYVRKQQGSSFIDLQICWIYQFLHQGFYLIQRAKSTKVKITEWIQNEFVYLSTMHIWSDCLYS